eukprot:3141899-Amphidinium_carterae.1
MFLHKAVRGLAQEVGHCLCYSWVLELFGENCAKPLVTLHTGTILPARHHSAAVRASQRQRDHLGALHHRQPITWAQPKEAFKNRLTAPMCVLVGDDD